MRPNYNFLLSDVRTQCSRAWFEPANHLEGIADSQSEEDYEALPFRKDYNYAGLRHSSIELNWIVANIGIVGGD